jgi:hypothetical protein
MNYLTCISCHVIINLFPSTCNVFLDFIVQPLWKLSRGVSLRWRNSVKIFFVEWSEGGFGKEM